MSCFEGESARCRIGFPIRRLLFGGEVIGAGQVDIAQTDAFYRQVKVGHLVADEDAYLGKCFVGDTSAAGRFFTLVGRNHGIRKDGVLLRWIEVGYIGQFFVVHTGLIAKPRVMRVRVVFIVVRIA